MLFVMKAFIIVICVKYFISFFLITMFVSFITLFSKIKNCVKLNL